MFAYPMSANLPRLSARRSFFARPRVKRYRPFAMLSQSIFLRRESLNCGIISLVRAIGPTDIFGKKLTKSV